MILFMEVRNQFVHNSESSSFIKIFEILEPSKWNKLLKINPDAFNIYKYWDKQTQDDSAINEKESVLSLAFDKLHEVILKVLVKTYQKIIEDLEEESNRQIKLKFAERTERMLELIDESLIEFGDSFEKVLMKNVGGTFDFSKRMNNFVHARTIEKFKEEFPDMA